MARATNFGSIRTCCLVLGSICAVVYFIEFYAAEREHKGQNHESDHGIDPYTTMADLTMHLATIVCERNAEEIKVQLKSAIALTNFPLMIHVIADEKTSETVNKMLKEWEWLRTFKFRIVPAVYPKGLDSQIWRNMNAPCSSLKLFLPTILKDLDAVAFVDTDAIFLRPFEDLWSHFLSYSTQHIIGLAYDYRITQKEYVPEKKRIPYFIPSDADTGLMLMNLTRMRMMDWTNHVIDVYQKYQDEPSLKVYDRQLLNAALHFYPWRVFIMDCDWNFRQQLWLNRTRSCPDAENIGVSVAHVRREKELHPKARILMAVYDIYNKYEFDDGRNILLVRMEEAMAKHAEGIKKIGRPLIFYKHLRRM